MEKLVFATIATPRMAPDVLLFADSLRAFGGELAGAPFFVLTPNAAAPLSDEAQDRFKALDAVLVPFDMPEGGLEFPLAWVPYTAAHAERHLKGKTELLAWMLTDTLVIQPPTAFHLPQGIDLGYRPVHHTLLGSIYDKPLDGFWSLIYEHCGITGDMAFPMQTCVRDHTIRPYFNAGLLVVRPERGLLTTWGDEFRRIHRLPEYQPLYRQDERYQIFIHQAVLSGVILKMFGREEMHEFPEVINYPLNLHAAEVPPEIRPDSLNDLITCRHDGLENLHGKLGGLPVKEPLKSWLKERLAEPE